MSNKTSQEDGLFSRWSRRKLEAKSNVDPDPADTVKPDDTIASIEGQSAPMPEAEPEPDPVLEANRIAAEAVDIDALKYESDYSVFLKEGVPDALKRQALKALWRSNSLLANVDGLCDYDDDFGSPDLNMKTFESAWKIGKGYFDNEEETDTDDDVEIAKSSPDMVETHEAEENEPETGIGEEVHEAPHSEIAENQDVETQEMATDQNEDFEVVEKPAKISLRKRLAMNG